MPHRENATAADRLALIELRAEDFAPEFGNRWPLPAADDLPIPDDVAYDSETMTWRYVLNMDALRHAQRCVAELTSRYAH
jgi:hypothetical protein